MATAELDRPRHQVLQDAQVEAAAILAQARSDAEQIITSAQIIASATLQRARSRHLPRRQAMAGQAGQSTQQRPHPPTATATATALRRSWCSTTAGASTPP
ncbi:hypothetical protein [Nonomuraea aurantiaca]|uniref:hypothetical protein n=1 Tax=Nonomuraea aurantiaca TaxID=2878562 RepID=UPI001CD9B5B7|nr:hypothetical protein [Nonomuraea aurantiaca]MCA2222955.1 hypothetical protein [Nonomuraea aurantiaca]